MWFFYVKKEIKNINIVTVYLQSINTLPLISIFIFFTINIFIEIKEAEWSTKKPVRELS